MNKWIKRTAALSVSVGMMTPVLAACTSPNTSDNTERTLRIATTMGYSANDEYFRQRFTELYEFANPNVKIEIISAMDDRYMYGRPDPNEKPQDPLEKLKELMQGDNPPDIVMTQYEQLPDLISNNLLTQLDPLITKDKFDISDIVPAVIEGIKKVGEGKIYALAPTFNSSAVIYNKRLFDEAGVQYPTDKMTWEQTFDLARRLAKGEGENRKYGFSFSTYNMGGDMSYATQLYTAPLRLRMFDDNGEKMTVDSDQWENAWKTMLQIHTEKLVPGPLDMSKMNGSIGPNENYNPFQHDDFLSGRVAMAIINYGELDRIIDVMKNADRIQGFSPFEWDVVTLPVHPEAPDTGGFIGMDGIMSINAKAQDPEEAWKFLKFINGEDWARLKAGSSHNIVSRQKYIKTKDGLDYNQQAFTSLMPVPFEDTKLYLKNPRLYEVQSIGYQKLQQVMEGKLQVREALKQWQTEGDAMIQKLKENPNGEPGMPEPRTLG
ncbi:MULTISPECIES: ABC transporter substrate-binding protein [Paenibacillus]|uniref:ABC transporter substrate-binding protein n=1 Tax=Paenibacillus naphthalenovorans TaxID=162209 RepID=A0A0U2ILU2_9BACL|nr:MULTISPECIES: extracellular solute-binding protein [Paenibacillus]ALS21435.1 ABC transporter substrate-binding protein [Paenibacillus naphthalenovorans]